MSKKNAETYNQLIPSVAVIFEKDDKIVLLRRVNTGYMDGMYSLVAGHVEQDEYCLDAAVREAKEEAGVVVKKEDLMFVHAMHRVAGQDRVDFYFLVRCWDGEITNTEPHKCSDLDWYDWNQLPKEQIIPGVYQALCAIRERVYFSESST